MHTHTWNSFTRSASEIFVSIHKFRLPRSHGKKNEPNIYFTLFYVHFCSTALVCSQQYGRAVVASCMYLLMCVIHTSLSLYRTVGNPLNSISDSRIRQYVCAQMSIFSHTKYVHLSMCTSLFLFSIEQHIIVINYIFMTCIKQKLILCKFVWKICSLPWNIWIERDKGGSGCETKSTPANKKWLKKTLNDSALLKTKNLPAFFINALKRTEWPIWMLFIY